MDALDLANYIAIACFDMGILFLYYFFEWYQSKYGRDDKSSTTDNTQVEEEDEEAAVKLDVHQKEEKN